MKPAPLQLERHFFSKVEINSHVDGVVGTPNLLNFQVEIGMGEPTERRFQITLKLGLISQPNTKPTYTGDIHAIGIFHVVEGWPQERIAELVETNGPSMLYGAIRELVFNLTSRGPWPPVLLSAFSFVPEKGSEVIPPGALVEIPAAPSKDRPEFAAPRSRKFSLEE